MLSLSCHEWPYSTYLAQSSPVLDKLLALHYSESFPAIVDKHIPNGYNSKVFFNHKNALLL